MDNEYASVLLIDDDADVRISAGQLLTAAGLPCRTLADPTQATKSLPRDWPGVVVSDVRMPGLDGEALLAALKAIDDQLPVILVTGHGDIPMAIRAVRSGAFEFLEKPVAPEALIDCVNRALAQRRDVIDNRCHRAHELGEQLLGKSNAMAQARDKLMQLAGGDLAVLITGEAGTGKRTAARELHRLGRYAAGPLVILDGELAEAGAPLTAWYDQYWTAALGGTLVIRHPEALPARLQAALCHWILETEPQASGMRAVRPVTLALADLAPALSDGRLRPDLYYALSAAAVGLPALRQRREDISLLFRHFMQQSCRRMRKPRPEISKPYLDNLVRANWPGNLQELRNVAELYAIGLARVEGVGRMLAASEDERALDERIDAYEKEVIEGVLALFNGRISETADYLRIPRKKLYLRMRKHGLDKAEFRK